MDNPYMDKATEVFNRSVSTESLSPSQGLAITKVQSLLAITFEMNRFNNLLEDENKKGGTFWYLRSFLHRDNSREPIQR